MIIVNIKEEKYNYKERQSTSQDNDLYRLVHWECLPSDAVNIIRLTIIQRDNIFKSIRQFYHIDEETQMILRLSLTSSPIENIDEKWEKRVQYLFHRSLDLEKLMWNLSTLGGAFSAMGDYQQSFADRAAITSHYQLRVAIELGDPSLIARCLLYISLSTAQKGHFQSAKSIIKKIHVWAKNNKDDHLVGCCEGVWMKVRSIHRSQSQLKKRVT